MPPISVMIKPASGLCNLRCKYCFYADEMNHREVQSYGMMTEETMEQIIQKCMDFAQGTSCHFGFQGGEPTLRGLDFFRQFVAVATACNAKSDKPCQLSYALQTNGTVIDEAWATFFAEHKFLVGLSLDGDRSAHDLHRIDAQNKGTYGTVLKTAKLLEKHKVEFNILTVITAYTAKHIGQIYKFFMKNNMVYQQYIPCLDPLEEAHGLHPYSLTPELYGQFLIRLFDCWYADRMAGKFVYIRYFENLAAAMMGHPTEACGFMGRCSLQTVIEADGSAYPCDFYMLDQYKIGNFNDDTMDEINARRGDSGFLEQSLQGLEQCQKCQYYQLCRGGCRRDRQSQDLGTIGENYFCPSFKAFFAHAAPKMAQLLRQVNR